MANSGKQSDGAGGGVFIGRLVIRRLYAFLAPRAVGSIMFAALFCTLSVKFFQAVRLSSMGEYLSWVLSDISVLLSVEAILVLLCFRWPKRRVIRGAMIFAAVICTWSVINASWVIRTGTQMLPSVLLPLFRDPANRLAIVGVNLAKMPVAAVALLAPSAVALTFFFFAVTRVERLPYSRKYLSYKLLISCVLILAALLGRGFLRSSGSVPISSYGLRFNSQFKAVSLLLSFKANRKTKTLLAQPERSIPRFDQVEISPPESGGVVDNVIIVVLEGVQYNYTSMGDSGGNLTPFMAGLGKEGAEFSNMRSSLTHTTKAIFSLLTGRYPSVYHGLAETVPRAAPYASLATILRDGMNFRTAFFQSAKGNFESRPGLVFNLGFDKFWARDDLCDPNAFVGYLGCDEFAMLGPVTDWIQAGQAGRPFFLTILCSITHDPYDVPEWFAEPAKEEIERYRQSILYTDSFLAALDVELTKLNLGDNTILCVVGDHGEAFGEHGLSGHERIAFEEVVRVPWVMRARSLIEPGTRVTEAVSSIDLTPTVLSLLGFGIGGGDFDGLDVLGAVPKGRKVYFSGWLLEGPAGYVVGERKFIYNPATEMVSIYDLRSDRFELMAIEVDEQDGESIAEDIIRWREKSLFGLAGPRTGKKVVFDSWLCRWNNRDCMTKRLD